MLSAYETQATGKIHQIIEEMQCRPILFVGSGFGRRYADLPNWQKLLEQASQGCPTFDKDFTYYLQKNDGDLIALASEMANVFFEFAWTEEGKKQFPKVLYEKSEGRELFLKQWVCDYIKNLLSDRNYLREDYELADEIKALSSVNPYAIITTNYDDILESIFSEYVPVVGEHILRADLNTLGDILKIHGCTSDCNSLVLTGEDFQGYREKRKYLSAKLLTYFLEHPVLFIGYSVSDPNIREILADIDLVLASKGNTISNIFLLTRAEEGREPEHTATIQTHDERYVRVNLIETNSFDWAFNAFSHAAPVEMNIQILRRLQSVVQRIVRSDVATSKIQVDYSAMESFLGNDEAFQKVFAIAPIDHPEHININYPYILSDVGKILGYPGWHGAKNLLEKIKNDKGVDVYHSDNAYHVRIQLGKSYTHKFSPQCVELLKQVQGGGDYEVSL